MDSDETIAFVTAVRRGDIALLHEACEIADGEYNKNLVSMVRQKSEKRVVSEFGHYSVVDRWSVIEIAIVQALEIENCKSLLKLFLFGFHNGFWVGIESALTRIIVSAKKGISSDLEELVFWLLSHNLIHKKEDLNSLCRIAVIHNVLHWLEMTTAYTESVSPADLVHAYPHILELLFSQTDFDVCTVDREGKTTLFYVESKQQIDLLLRYSSDLYHMANDGSTPLFDAVLRNKKKAELLLDHYGADLHKPNKAGLYIADWLVSQVERNCTFTDIFQCFDFLEKYRILYSKSIDTKLRRGVQTRTRKLFQHYIGQSDNLNSLSIELQHYIGCYDDIFQLLRSLRAYCVTNKSFGAMRKLNRLAPKALQVFVKNNGVVSLYDQIKDKADMKWFLTACPQLRSVSACF